MLNLDKFSRVHASLLGTSPTERQLGLYGAFPKAHGFFLEQAPDAALFEAVTVMGLAMTYPLASPDVMQRVWFLVPAHTEEWAVQELESIATRIFTRIREEANLKAAKFMHNAFTRLLLGSRAFEFEGSPDYWVAYGFKNDDPVPDWLQNGLLAV